MHVQHNPVYSVLPDICACMRAGMMWPEIAQHLNWSLLELRRNWMRYVQSLSDAECAQLEAKCMPQSSSVADVSTADAISTDAGDRLSRALARRLAERACDLAYAYEAQADMMAHCVQFRTKALSHAARLKRFAVRIYRDGKTSRKSSF